MSENQRNWKIMWKSSTDIVNENAFDPMFQHRNRRQVNVNPNMPQENPSDQTTNKLWALLKNSFVRPRKITFHPYIISLHN